MSVSFCAVLLNVIAQPVKADTGDSIVMLIVFLIAFVFVCAGLGVYARRYDEAYKL